MTLERGRLRSRAVADKEGAAAGSARTRLSISGRARVVGIFGDPVEHSRSPAMHNAAFAALGLDWVYVPFRVDGRDLAAAVAAVRALGMAGVNVTVPHKEAVLTHLDDLTPLARQAGAVNTVVNRGGRLCGENTDIAGFERAVKAAGVRVRGRHVVVVGAGGAARAVLVGLGRLGAGRVTIANRTPARARALAAEVDGRIAADPVGIDVLLDPGYLAGAVLVVNATSAGLSGAPFPPLAYAGTPRECLFFDLVYGAGTAFLRNARRAQRRAVDGTEMLLHQGAAAFTLWTRRRPPLEVMRAALR